MYKVLLRFSIILCLCVCIPLYADLRSTLYDSSDTIIESSLPKDTDISQMQQDQMDVVRKEFRGNPASTDLLYYKQDKLRKEIEKDSILKIKPEYSTQDDLIVATEQYPFIMQYFFKIVDEVPTGEDYKISIPIKHLRLHSTPNRICEIQTRQSYLNITLYNHYTKAQMQASVRKQTQYLLYNLLQEYKAEVIECLMLNQAHLDDMNTTLNLESRTKTIISIHSYVLVDFHGSILTLQVFDPQK